MKSLIKIGIQRRNALLLPKGEGHQGIHSICAFLADIGQFGYVFNNDVVDALKTMTDEQFSFIHQSTVEILSEIRGASVKYNPLFKNFPFDIPQHNEYIMRRIFGYVENLLEVNVDGATELECGHSINTQLFNLNDFGACPICQMQVPELLCEKRTAQPLKDKVSIAVISLASLNDVVSVYSNLIGGKGTLSEKDKEDIEAIVRENEENIVYSFLPEQIHIKENLAFITELFENAGYKTEILFKYFKTSTDVLRLAASLSGGDASLKESTKFKLKNSLRRLVLKLINGIDAPEVDMLKHREKWLRLGEVIHPYLFQKKYPVAANAFDLLRNNPELIPSFNRKVEALVCSVKKEMEGAWHDLTIELAARPGEFARRLDFLMSNAKDQEFVVSTFKRVIHGVSTPLLLNLSKYLGSRVEQGSFRYFVPKGHVAKGYYQDYENRQSLNVVFVKKIQDVITDEVKSRFSSLPEMGNVFIDPALYKILVPTAQRNASDSSIRLQRGTRIGITDSATTARLFCYWKESSWSGRVDVDLSAVVLDSEFSYLEHVSYSRIKSKDASSYHSGDVQSAPFGAAEFIDINIDSILQAGGRYVGISIFSYTSQTFDDFQCFAGFMEREYPGSGEAFEAATVKQKFSVSGKFNSFMPLLLDLHTREILWIDMPLKSRGTHNIEQNMLKITQTCKAINKFLESKSNVGELIALHVKARNGNIDNILDNSKHYDKIFDVDFATDIDKISKDWL